jgi:hypothetical protein
VGDIDLIASQLPEVNRLLFIGVVRLIREFSKNEAKNRMSVKNLVIVLVPSILRYELSMCSLAPANILLEQMQR